MTVEPSQMVANDAARVLTGRRHPWTVQILFKSGHLIELQTLSVPEVEGNKASMETYYVAQVDPEKSYEKFQICKVDDVLAMRVDKNEMEVKP